MPYNWPGHWSLLGLPIELGWLGIALLVRGYINAHRWRRHAARS
jgi:hypothetical protein